MNTIIIFSVLLLCFWFVDTSSAASRRHPVIYIPGDGGSRLEARTTQTKGSASTSANCLLTSEWRRLWLDVYQLATSWRVKCWAENIQLVHDFKDGKNKNVDGVETRVPGFGGTETVELIDPSWLAWAIGDAGNVAKTLVRHMTSKWGYKRGFDVRGAPYDFRFAPKSQPEYFRKLKALIEETVEQTGERAIVLTHSLGGVFGLHFLSSMTSSWKRRFIHAFVPMGAPWAGSAVAFNLYVAGDARGIKTVDPKIIREEQRSYETGVLLLPSQSLWTPAETIFAQTPTKNYTTANYDQFFADLKYPVGKINHDYVKNTTAHLTFPNVTVYCIYSRGTPTPVKFLYSDSGFLAGDQPEEKLYGDGDGTVNIQSLQLCQKWTTHSKGEKYVVNKGDDAAHIKLTADSGEDSTADEQLHAEAKVFDKVTHEDLMKSEKVFDYLENIFIEK